jgi:hypothetical protein
VNLANIHTRLFGHLPECVNDHSRRRIYSTLGVGPLSFKYYFTLWKRVTTRLFTSSWMSMYVAWMFDGELPVAPVRISRGLPRWWPEAASFPYVEQLAPDGWMLAVGKTDPERADRGYRRSLHVLGVERAMALIAAAVGDDPRPPALCCFEKNPVDCHRGQFSLWFRRKTGERVRELSLLQGIEGGVALVWEQAPTISPGPDTVHTDTQRKGAA